MTVIYSIGSVLVTGSKYGTAKLWDMKEHKCTCTFEDCHSDEITCVIMKVSYELTMSRMSCNAYLCSTSYTIV